jgi:hypothetical protein
MHCITPWSLSERYEFRYYPALIFQFSFPAICYAVDRGYQLFLQPAIAQNSRSDLSHTDSFSPSTPRIFWQERMPEAMTMTGSYRKMVLAFVSFVYMKQRNY